MRKYSVLFVIAFILSTLACSIFVGGPSYLDKAIPVSTEELQNLQTNLEQAATDAANTGTINLQITESQLTSYLAFKLDQQPHPLITDPQVLLRGGQIDIFGKAQSGIFTANIRITAQASVDVNGEPKIEIVQSDFGPLPAPQGINDGISAFLHEAFTGTLGPVATGFRLDSVTITDGVMTVSGKVK